MKNLFHFDDDNVKFWIWFLILSALTITVSCSVSSVSHAYQCVHAPETCVENHSK